MERVLEINSSQEVTKAVVEATGELGDWAGLRRLYAAPLGRIYLGRATGGRGMKPRRRCFSAS